MPGTIALTGGTGFIGQHLIRRLLAGGWEVRALTRRPAALAAAPGLIPLEGALDQPAALARLLEGATAVIHAAGLIKARNRAAFDAVNVAGTENLLTAALAQPRAPKFLHISSLAAREPALSDYAASKRASEAVLEAKAGALTWQVLRPPAVYGPGDTMTLQLFRQFSWGLALLPGRHGRFSLLHVEDLAAAVLVLLDSDLPSGQVMELDDGRPGGYGWPEVTAAAGAGLGKNIRSFVVPRALLRGLAAVGTGLSRLTGRVPLLTQGKVNEISHPDWVCHQNRLDEVTPWRPRIGIDEGFAETISWYKSQGWL